MYFPAAKYIKERNKPAYRTQAVSEGDIVLNVNATGNVEPVLRVTVGAVVSGPINELYVDFNEVVEKDQLMAKINQLERERAELQTCLDEALQELEAVDQEGHSKNRKRSALPLTRSHYM